jgi:hypothetical protein
MGWLRTDNPWRALPRASLLGPSGCSRPGPGGRRPARHLGGTPRRLRLSDLRRRGHARTYRGPTRRSEAALTDHGTPRPYLPDPQRDRHVSFPDEPPDQRSRVGSLPPGAWAPRPSGPAAAQRPPVPRRSNNRGAGLIAALVVVPLFFGVVNSGASGSSSAEEGYAVEMGSDQWRGGDGGTYVGAEGLTIQPVADEASADPLLSEATTVQGVPADTAQVRIEVAGTHESVDFEVVGPDGGVLENTVDEPLPLARIATKPPDDRVTMHVHAKDASGDTELQCRIYAGTVLVALDTGRSNVTCTVTW